MKKWKSWKIENVKRIENLEDIKYFIFHSFMFGWKDEKFFYLVGKKNETIKNVICINLFSCPFKINKGLL